MTSPHSVITMYSSLLRFSMCSKKIFPPQIERVVPFFALFIQRPTPLPTYFLSQVSIRNESFLFFPWLLDCGSPQKNPVYYSAFIPPPLSTSLFTPPSRIIFWNRNQNLLYHRFFIPDAFGHDYASPSPSSSEHSKLSFSVPLYVSLFFFG